MKLFKFLAILLLTTWIASDASAQLKSKYFYVGISAGVTNYQGDLDDNFTLKFTKPGLGIIGAWRFHPHMAVRLQINQGWMGASDEKAATNVPRIRRNLSFRSAITEAAVTVMYEFFANKRKFKYRPIASPYIFGGGAVFAFKPQAKLGNEWVDLQPLGTEGQFLATPCEECPKEYPKPYSLVQFSIPFGGGVRIRLTEKIDLWVEMGLRKTFTDYLDDVSGFYPNMADLQASNPLAYQLSDRIDRTVYPQGAGGNYAPIPGQPGSYAELGVNGVRGFNTQTDWYVMSMVTGTYILDWVKCPKFR